MSTEGGVKPPEATETKPALTSTTSTPSSTVTTTQSSTPSVTTPKSSSQPLVNWGLIWKRKCISNLTHCYAPSPSKKRGHIALLFFVCFSVGRSTNCFLSFSSQMFYILKWNFIYRFIILISRSSYILGTIELFSTELCLMD